VDGGGGGGGGDDNPYLTAKCKRAPAPSPSKDSINKNPFLPYIAI